jgi:hypothetical protein
MNFIKKSLLVLSLLSFTACALAQGTFAPPKHVFKSFLADKICSLNVSNAVLGVTNLLTKNGHQTNEWGVVFTNCVTGSRSMVTNYAAITNTAATLEYFNLLSDVELWADRNGSGAPVGTWTTLTNTPYSVFVRLVGQSGANAAMTFVFTPLFDGTNETTVAGQDFAWAVTANTTTEVCLVTNIFDTRFQHAKKIRCRSISNADTDATSTVTILSLGLVGFQP